MAMSTLDIFLTYNCIYNTICFVKIVKTLVETLAVYTLIVNHAPPFEVILCKAQSDTICHNPVKLYCGLYKNTIFRSIFLSPK